MMSFLLMNIWFRLFPWKLNAIKLHSMYCHQQYMYLASCQWCQSQRVIIGTKFIYFPHFKLFIRVKNGLHGLLGIYKSMPGCHSCEIWSSINETSQNKLIILKPARAAQADLIVHIPLWPVGIMRVGWKAYMMTPYLLLMTFLINGIQAQQHWWKKCVNHEGD